MNTRKLTYGGLITALAILLPQALHIMLGAQAGKMFLPMHLPVLLGGFVLGPVFGLVIGVISPIFSALITGMPAMDRLPFMVIELAGYGFVGGLMYNKLLPKRRAIDLYLSLTAAMVAGRLLYAASLFAAAEIFNIPGAGAIIALTATATGIYGIVLQLILIPPVVVALERSGFLAKYVRTRKTA